MNTQRAYDLIGSAMYCLSWILQDLDLSQEERRQIKEARSLLAKIRKRYRKQNRKNNHA